MLNGVTKVTYNHPFYVYRDGLFHIVETQNLKIGDRLFTVDNQLVPVSSLVKFNQPISVYNLEDVTPNNSYFANSILVHNKGGGGCFLPQILIDTTQGKRAISTLRPGDRVISWDATSQLKKESTIGGAAIYEMNDYYILNNDIQVTATHPFYIKTFFAIQIKEVNALQIGDQLIGENQIIPLRSIKHINKRVTVYNLVDVSPYNNYYAQGVLVHNKGGGFGGGHGGSSPSPFYYGGRYYYSSSSCQTILDPVGRQKCKDYFNTGAVFGFFSLLIYIGIFVAIYASKAKNYLRRGQQFSSNQALIS